MAWWKQRHWYSQMVRSAVPWWPSRWHLLVFMFMNAIFSVMDLADFGWSSDLSWSLARQPTTVWRAGYFSARDLRWGLRCENLVRESCPSVLVLILVLDLGAGDSSTLTSTTLVRLGETFRGFHYRIYSLYSAHLVMRRMRTCFKTPSSRPHVVAAVSEPFKSFVC